MKLKVGGVNLKPHTYPEMNTNIKNILKMSDDPLKLYALQKIIELEEQVKKLEVYKQAFEGLESAGVDMKK